MQEIALIVCNLTNNIALIFQIFYNWFFFFYHFIWFLNPIENSNRFFSPISISNMDIDNKSITLQEEVNYSESNTSNPS